MQSYDNFDLYLGLLWVRIRFGGFCGSDGQGGSWVLDNRTAIQTSARSMVQSPSAMLKQVPRYYMSDLL